MVILLWMFIFFNRTKCNFKLESLQSYKLAQLYLKHDLSLGFNILQRNQTEVELFAIKYREKSVFVFTTSTKENKIYIEFLLENGLRKKFDIHCPFFYRNDKHHNIVFILDGQKIVITVNCRQLFSTEDAELKFGNYLINELHAAFGPQLASYDSGLQIREFTADTAKQIANHCLHLEVLIDNPVLTTKYHLGEKLLNERETEVDNQIIEKIAKHDNTMVHRIELLENEITHWQKLFTRFENRIKRVELHLRGCTNVNGQPMTPGQRILNPFDCTECQCRADANLHCKPIGCPQLNCSHPVQVQGKCCPECGKRCLYNGALYESGEVFWPKKCVHCACNNGRMECGYKMAEKCPILDCVQQETLPNHCCPTCINVDHCAAKQNTCSKDAICISEKHSAKCRCKEGFFGNGTICYDIDECQWDGDARTQLGGCGDGTFCINLPGSFQCECLPGYQKLDNKNCLDVIRI